MAVPLTELVRRLCDVNTFATLCTVNPDGSPQSTVVWIKADGDQLLFSTIHGRRKTLNMQRDPRVSICMFDAEDPYSYTEIRGTVSMTEDGGPELINELSWKYDGVEFVEGSPDNVRVVCRVTPTRIN
jgi:PPOX class probable F420-dependent enzyme